LKAVRSWQSFPEVRLDVVARSTADTFVQRIATNQRNVAWSVDGLQRSAERKQSESTEVEAVRLDWTEQEMQRLLEDGSQEALESAALLAQGGCLELS
jgi:hypothetical protein